MADEQNTTEEIIRNGFRAITSSDIECTANITYEQAIAMSAIFKAIERLTQDNTIKELCNHGALQADLQANDIDGLRERVMEAGIVGKLVEEKVKVPQYSATKH